MKHTKTIKLLIAASLAVFPALVAAQSQPYSIQNPQSILTEWVSVDTALLGSGIDSSMADSSPLTRVPSNNRVEKNLLMTGVRKLVTNLYVETKESQVSFYNDAIVKKHSANPVESVDYVGKDNLLLEEINYLDNHGDKEIITDGRGTVLSPYAHLHKVPDSLQIKQFVKTPQTVGFDSSMLRYVDGRGTTLFDSSMLRYVDGRGTTLAPQHLVAGNMWTLY